MKNLDSKTILIIVAALIVAAGLYWYFFTGTGNEPPLSVTSGEPPASATFDTLIGELGPISFDTAILTDPRFTSLADLSTPVTPEPSGRLDPFASLGSGGITSP